MKKIFVCFLVMLLFLSLVACSNDSTDSALDLNGFHYIFNENGDYLWLGMSRQQAGEVFDLVEIDSSDSDTNPTLSHYGIVDDDAIIVEFENGRITGIGIFEGFNEWFFLQEISLGSSLQEIEAIFGSYTPHPNSEISGMRFWAFTKDHVPVGRFAEDAYYAFEVFFDRDTQTIIEAVTMYIIRY